MEQEKIEIIKPKTDKLDYSYKVLSNGLKVLLISDSDAHKSAAALAVNIGSLVDKKDEQGLAHFCEHLLMMGSKKYPKEDYLREYLSKNGGMMNAATSNDRTIFFLMRQMPDLKQHQISFVIILSSLHLMKALLKEK